MEPGTTTDSSPRVRLLAVMAADAAGYSRLMSLDDHGTLAALDAARAVFRAGVEVQQGRVIDMAGDSVLAVFENATAAVKAALTIQTHLAEAAGTDRADDRRMRFRIGVHLGDVIEKPDGSVYGDGVNIAARLQSLAQPGGVMVSESVRITVKGRVAAGFEDQGDQQVKNIAEAVRAFCVSSTSGVPGTQALPSIGTASALDPSLVERGLGGQPSIAVLPFTMMSDDPEQTFLGDGLADDIIGSLATVDGLLVIARSSTFAYAGRGTDARAVGQELGVRYVVEGTLRLMVQRMRFNVRLIDCRTNSCLWSERFDAPVVDLLTVQDEVTAQIMNAIRVTIDRSEARQSRKLNHQDLQAWQCRVQALDHFYRWNRVDMLKAIELSRRAIELAPDEAEGYARLSAFLWSAGVSGWVPSGVAALEEALTMANRAINLDEALAWGHVAMACVLLGLRRHDEAISAAERSRELAPGSFNANSQLGTTLAYAGRYGEALPYLDHALRLSPKDPMLFWVYQSRSIALFGLVRYEEVIAAALRVSRQLPEWVEAHTMLAAGLMGLGKREQAVQAMSDARKLDVRLSVRRVLRRHPIRDVADAQRLANYLREAGLAEN